MNPVRAGLVVMLLVFADALPARAENAVIRLWPEKAPGEQGPVEPETFTEGRVTNVSEPTLTVYPAPREKATGAGVIIAPGGAYRFLSWPLEGTEIAEWFNRAGVTAFVLKYRVPRRSFDTETKLPLMDAQRAVSVVRRRAKEWGVDPARIGFLGFSAGGHLAAHLASTSGTRAYEAMDDTDKTSSRPDFSVLIYPGGLLDRQDATRLAPEMRLSKEMPPTFLAVAADDTGSVGNSIRYFELLRAAGAAGELHVYAGGGHGFGIRPRAGASATWTDRVVDWLRGMKILPAASP
jgi:acetyl esterase/lipase